MKRNGRSIAAVGVMPFAEAGTTSDSPVPRAEAQGHCVDLLLTLWHRADGSALAWGRHAEAGRAVLRQSLVP